MSDAPTAPIRVTLVVYDLLPPGRLASAAFVFGVGFYHTAIRISHLDREYAFGGHPYPALTGIFSTAVRADHRPPIEGLRWLRDVDMGEVKVPEVESENRREVEGQPGRSGTGRGRSKELPRPTTTDKDLPELPSRPSVSQDHGSESSKSPVSLNPPHGESLDYHYPPRSADPFASTASFSSLPLVESPTASTSTIHLPPTTSSSHLPDLPPTGPAAQLAFVQQVLSHLQASSSWRGTSYDLIHRNCNSFSDEFCRLLTGKGIPGWCNRAAALGGMMPCLVPQDWVEPPSAPATPNMPATYERIHMAV